MGLQGAAEGAGLIGIIVSVYLYIKRNPHAGALIWILTGVGLLINFLSLRYYHEDAIKFIADSANYCGQRESTFDCWAGWEYGRLKSAEKAEVIEKPVIRIVYKDRFIPLRESSLLESDLNKINAFIGLPIESARYTLGKMIGIDDITLFGTSSINAPGLVQYQGVIRYDNVVQSLRAFEPSCLNYSQIRVIVQDGLIKNITWTGDVKKVCFDTVWQPNIAKVRDFQSVREMLDKDSDGDKIARYYDDSSLRNLFLTVRPMDLGKDHVGIRISAIKTGSTLTTNYFSYEARGVWKDVAAIAAL